MSDFNEALMRRARQDRPPGYNDCHDIDGHFFELSAAQDGAVLPCAGCGLRLPATAPLSAHRLDCPSYVAHPNSVTAWLVDYEASHGTDGAYHVPGNELTITYINNHGA